MLSSSFFKLQLRCWLLQHNLHGLHKQIHSQQFALTKPRFTALCEVLAMEVYKPQCHLTEADHRSFETRLMMEKVLFFRVHKDPPMKRSCYCGKTRKRPNFGIHFLDVFDERNLRFTTVPYSFKKQNVLLRARFPVRRDVYGIVLPTSHGNFMEFHGISINGGGTQ